MSFTRILIPAILILQAASGFSQTFWKITSEKGEQVLLTIEVNEKKNEFEAYTRKDALKDIAGPVNYVLALTAGKIQYPEIIYIQGKTSRHADSLILNGTFYYVDRKYPFRASIYGNHIWGSFIDKKNKLNRMYGIKVSGNRPLNDYHFIVRTSVSLTERHLFNREWLRSDEWIKYKSRLTELTPLIADDYEIGVVYIWLTRSLPFQPYELSRENPLRKTASAVRKMSVRFPEPKTALIDGSLLPVNTREMDTIAQVLEKKNAVNLIIDLRGKNRISPECIEYIGNYLSPKPIIGGVYPTRRYFDINQNLPKSTDYSRQFKSFSELHPDGIGLYNENGRYFNIVPAKKTFSGKVYILTDSKTSGPASALIYIFKKHKLATIAGQTASIASGLSEKVTINHDFSLLLVISEFFTPENRKLTEGDLEPDISLKEGDALQYLLQKL